MSQGVGTIKEYMAMSLRDFVSKEICELTIGIVKILAFSGVEVRNLDTDEVIRIEGPISLDRFGTFPMKLTNPRTRMKVEVPGVRMWVDEEDGEKVEKPLNVVSKRLIGQLHGDLESGAYMNTRYQILAIEPPPKTRYQIRRSPRSLEGEL